LDIEEINMCNFWSAIITREEKILWHGNISSHNELVKKHGLKDDKLENRDFVRIEYNPQPKTFSLDKSKWDFKVDEKETLPDWFVKKQPQFEKRCWTILRAHIADVRRYGNMERVEKFLVEIPKINWCRPDGKPNKKWVLHTAPTLAAARDAARDAAWNAAGNAAWDAAGNAARDVAGDAALYAKCLFAAKIKGFNKKFLLHAEARMEVWRKGYCLKCDVNGKLYVYAKEVVKT
jgi:hypothetical protein